MSESSIATADDLTPQQRQILGLLQRNGERNVAWLAHATMTSDVQMVVDRCKLLAEMGLVRFLSRSRVGLTAAGRSLRLQGDSINKRFEPQYEAGMLPQQIERAETRLRQSDLKRERREHRRNRANSPGTDEQEDDDDLPAYSSGWGRSLPADRGIVTSPELPELPEDFVEEAVGQLRIAVRAGNFDAVRSLADSLRHRWRLLKLSRSPLAKRPLGERLATCLSECHGPDGKRINVRIINAIESVCPATLGAILERWPSELLKCHQIGPACAATVGHVLITAGLLSIDDFEERMQESCGNEWRHCEHADA